MKRSSRGFICYPALLMMIVGICQGGEQARSKLEQIRQSITEQGAAWQATENWVTRLPPDEQKRLFGGIAPPQYPPGARLMSIPRIDNLPSHFDWRNNNGNWITPPKHQNVPVPCGGCWAFATIGQVESWWKIHHNQPDSNINLSEQFLLSCSGAGDCDGFYYWSALEFIRTSGVPDETCFPYQADDTVPCSQVCSDWSTRAVRIPGWGYVTLGEANLESIKSAVFRFPVQAYFDVYADFSHYSTGVYSHVWGGWQGGHVVLVVGWDDDQQAWICKNSAGTDWGETVNFTPHTPGAGNGGYFRIKYGACNMGIAVQAIWNGITGGPAFSLSRDQFVVELDRGDTASLPVRLYNRSPGRLEFVTADFQTTPGGVFHSTAVNSYDGESWWCGDQGIGGYGDYWFQYLDLPVLDLSQTVGPTLTFVGSWSVEAPSQGPNPDYDGWDGCNVQVSVDAGGSFQAAIPDDPVYSCTSLSGFGSGLWGWGMGPGTGGWAGKSNGWTSPRFDLSPYRADSVIVRFALASDRSLSTPDDPGLYGFLVDDIMIFDGGTVLFENHGEPDGTMRAGGFAGSDNAEWLTVDPAGGTIAPDDSLAGTLRIDTQNLQPGRYCGMVFFITNDTSYLPMEGCSGRIRIDLEVRQSTSARDHGITTPAVWSLEQNYPNPFNPTTTIRYELAEADHVRLVVCDLLGSEVAVLANEKQDPGTHEVKFVAKGLSSGVYFYRLHAGHFVQTRSMYLLK